MENIKVSQFIINSNNRLTPVGFRRRSLGDDYTLVATNIPGAKRAPLEKVLEAAKVIGFGELHNRPATKRLNVQTLNKLWCDGASLLLEGGMLPALLQKQFGLREEAVKTNLFCWDDPEALKQVHTVQQVYCQALPQLFKGANQIVDSYTASPLVPLQDQTRGTRATEIADAIDTWESTYKAVTGTYARQIYETCPARNKNLLESCRNAAATKNKVFLFAGAAHLDHRLCSGEERKSVEAIYEGLSEKRIPFAMVVPRRKVQVTISKLGISNATAYNPCANISLDTLLKQHQARAQYIATNGFPHIYDLDRDVRNSRVLLARLQKHLTTPPQPITSPLKNLPR